jgi:hypothetical protein
VDASGNFSITVLRTALQRSHNLELERRLASNLHDPSVADVSVCSTVLSIVRTQGCSDGVCTTPTRFL